MTYTTFNDADIYVYDDDFEYVSGPFEILDSINVYFSDIVGLDDGNIFTTAADSSDQIYSNQLNKYGEEVSELIKIFPGSAADVFVSKLTNGDLIILFSANDAKISGVLSVQIASVNSEGTMLNNDSPIWKMEDTSYSTYEIALLPTQDGNLYYFWKSYLGLFSEITP